MQHFVPSICGTCCNELPGIFVQGWPPEMPPAVGDGFVHSGVTGELCDQVTKWGVFVFHGYVV